MCYNHVMKKIAITTETNSGMIPHATDAEGIFVLPMPFIIDGREHLEYVDLSAETFYEKLCADCNISTSQPSVTEVTEFWTEILKEYDEIVHIPTSTELSASRATASSLAKDFDGKVQRVVEEIFALIGEPIPKEVERKFLIRKPTEKEI